MKRVWFAAGCLCTLVPFGVMSDTLNADTLLAATKPEFSFAEHLLDIGKPEFALVETERLLHVNKLPGTAFASHLTDSLLASGMVDKSEKLNEHILEGAVPNSGEYTAASLGLIKSYLLERKPLLARTELDVLQFDSLSKDSADIRTFYRSLTFAVSYQIDSARMCLENLTAGSKFADEKKELLVLLDWYQSTGMKNPLNAYLYSSALPGLGHWYLGEKRKAVKSFLLMAGLTGILAYEGYHFYRGDVQERYVRGMDIFLVYSLAWRRYHGSIRKAAHQRAIEKNQNIQLEFQKRIKSLLVN